MAAVALDEKSLLREIGKVFGFTRSGKRINAMVIESISRLEGAKRVQRKEGKTTLIS